MLCVREDLHKAVIERYIVEVQSLLLNDNCDVNKPNENGDTPLKIALEWCIKRERGERRQAHLERQKIAMMLIDKGARLDFKIGGGSPLHAAARLSEELVERMVGRGVDVNLKNDYGETPLQIALNGNWNSQAIAQVLLDNGARLDHVDDKTRYFLATSVAKGSGLCFVKSLLFSMPQKCRDNLIKSVDAEGKTLLHQAVGEKSHPGDEIIKLLVENGADLDAKDKDGFAPIHYATHNWQTPTLASLGAKDAYWYLASNKRIEPFMVLGDARKYLEPGPDGLTALQLLLIYGKEDLGRYLVTLRKHWSTDELGSLFAHFLRFGRHDLCDEATKLTKEDVQAAVLSDNFDTIVWVKEQIKEDLHLTDHFDCLMKERHGSKNPQEMNGVRNEGLNRLFQAHPFFNPAIEDSLFDGKIVGGKTMQGFQSLHVQKHILKHALNPLCPLLSINKGKIPVKQLNLIEKCVSGCQQ